MPASSSKPSLSSSGAVGSGKSSGAITVTTISPPRVLRPNTRSHHHHHHHHNIIIGPSTSTVSIASNKPSLSSRGAVGSGKSNGAITVIITSPPKPKETDTHRGVRITLRGIVYIR